MPVNLVRSSSASGAWSFVDSLAFLVVEEADRSEFLGTAADLLFRGLSSREERSTIFECRSNIDSQEAYKPYLATLRLWSDTSTRSFVFAMQVVRLPKSKYFQIYGMTEQQQREQRQEKIQLRPQSALIVENTQRLVERKKWSQRWADERKLLTEEQLIAAMLPLDEVLELDELDIEAVAEYLHG